MQMKGDRFQLWWQLKAIGIFMVATGIGGTLLVTFVLPSNAYLSGVLILMLAMEMLAGLAVLAIGFGIRYKGAIIKTAALPALILSRLLRG
jgi:hypothetical protein